MATRQATASTLITHLGDSRWVRGHISTFFVGAVVLVASNLLIGGGSVWALTAIGIWIMLLVVHIIVIAIARLSHVLMADDEEEIVLLPIKDALVIEPKRDPASTWADSSPTPSNEGVNRSTSRETVSWSVATDAAQVKRTPSEESSS